MENCLRGKFLKNLRVLLEMTQEKMAGEFDVSSSMLRNIEQEKMPLSARLQTKIMKRLPILIISRLGDSLSLNNDPTQIGPSDWEKVLQSVRSLSPESIEENEIPEMAHQLYVFFPRHLPGPRDASRWSSTDIEPLCLDEKERKWYEKYQETLESMESKFSDELNYEEFQSPFGNTDHESIFTAKMDRRLLDKLNKEAANRGLTLSKLLESIVTYYFESKRLFVGETNE